MSDEVFLRDYRTADLEAIFRLDEACFAKEFRFDRKSMKELTEATNAVVRVAETGCGEIVGFVIVHVERILTGLQAYLVTLDVAEQYRHEGVARRLMQESEASAMTAGARWIQLHVFTGNEGAIRFYERAGYERIRVRRGFYGAPGLDAFVYGKELTTL